MRILLAHNRGFTWHSDGTVHAKGCVWAASQLYRDATLPEYFSSVTNEHEFADKLTNANGIFSIVMQVNGDCYIASDRTRTFPLFYARVGNSYVITDDTCLLIGEYAPDRYDQSAIDEFLATGYVTGSGTLLQDVYQTQAGEYTILSTSARAVSYFSLADTKYTEESAQDLADQFIAVARSVFARLIDSVGGRPIVLPLSGGYDSRFVAVMLKEYGYDNVFCYTFGRADNREIGISKVVAETLGYSWQYVEYSKELFGQFPDSDEFRQYMRYACNHVSVCNLLDFFAVRALAKQGIIAEGAVFVPGHTGDFIAGGHIPAALFVPAGIEGIVDCIVSKHYGLRRDVVPAICREKIASLLRHGIAHAQYEDWEWRERQAKYIVNANRTYEFFGFEHRIPLWDFEVIQFFKQLPLNLKKNKQFYDTVLERIVFKPFGLSFHADNKVHANRRIKAFRRNAMRMILPDTVLGYIEKYKRHRTQRRTDNENRQRRYCKDYYCYLDMIQLFSRTLPMPDMCSKDRIMAVSAYWYLNSIVCLANKGTKADIGKIE